MTRPYTLRKRAQKQEETRARIVEAVVALHQEVGPLHTTISAVADRAGVERLTVYRHFPDESSLFAACSSHYMAAHRPPDPACWMEIPNPRQRTLTALEHLYRYYREVEPMFAAVLRDAPLVSALQPFVAPYHDFLDSVRDDLHRAFDETPRDADLSRSDRCDADDLHEGFVQTERGSALRAFLGHAVQFATWQSLDRQGLRDEAMAAIMVGAIVGVAEHSLVSDLVEGEPGERGESRPRRE